MVLRAELCALRKVCYRENAVPDRESARRRNWFPPQARIPFVASGAVSDIQWRFEFLIEAELPETGTQGLRWR